jgi:diguanylate cyclase (GGDEF)-like protein
LTIRFRILAGCLALTLLTGLLGGFAQVAERRLGGVALDIYDNAFMAMSYLRAAQLDFSILGTPPRPEAGAEVLANLDVALGRAMSPRGHSQMALLRAEVAAILAHPGSSPHAAARITHDFERAVEMFADDGFRDRRRVQALVSAEQSRSLTMMAASLLAAMLITLLVSQLIVPPVRRAVRVAQAIAAGKLDNVITTRGSGETADLLRALVAMQSSIATAMARIEGLMAAQAATHAGEIFVRNARMSAALDNMNQGLCLFDAQDQLLVSNRRFAELFGPPSQGRAAREVLISAGLGALVDASAGRVGALSCELADGRVIAVAQQAVAGGGWVATYEDISERRAAEARLAHMARHDLVTGLPNRLLFSEHAASLLARAHQDRALALLCIDIDRFRVINDTLGHATGDALLRAVGQRVAACVPGGRDLVFRLGGNEFAILQEGDQPHDARLLAQRVADAMAEPFAIVHSAIQVSVTLGVALASDMEEPSPEAMLKCTGLAMERAKAEGGGCRFFEADMDVHLRQRRALELDLRQALALDQMLLFYQPQVVPGRGIKGFEALLRWQHPERGLVSPAVFIPVAEETGLIGALGDWVLRRACHTAAGWPGDIKVAVNLSPAQFRGRAIVRDVAAALAESRLAPNRLELEITEAVLLADDEQVLQTLHGLRALGVRIAMDDFGTGYSSLGYLSRFPFDKIKIDQSFVRAMTTRSDSLAIVRAVIGLGRSLGMKVNAEGVETREQMAILTAEGCDELQGYLFSRPQPEACVEEMLREHRMAA